MMHGPINIRIWLLFHHSMNTFGSTVTNTCPSPQPLRGSSHDRSFLSSSYRRIWGSLRNVNRICLRSHFLTFPLLLQSES